MNADKEPAQPTGFLPGATARTVLAVAALAGGLVALFGNSSASVRHRAGPPAGAIAVVAAENQYGSVASQIGGPYVKVSSIEDNPNTDPHAFELSPVVASSVEHARLVIQNGIGYDTFMNRLEAATPDARRRVIVVQKLLGISESTPNPHLWYKPTTMPAVAGALAKDLAAIAPAHAKYFFANVSRFDASLQPWLASIARFKRRFDGTTAVTTEPVADYLLGAMGIRNLSPMRFQADVMNGTDPSPQDISYVNDLVARDRVRVFVYNEQVVDPLTASIRTAAEGAKVPVVAVYETMPVHYDYQRWMLAETEALAKAIGHHLSTAEL